MNYFAEHKLRENGAVNVAVIFAIILFPLMLVGAAMIDTARQTSANHQIQAAIDAATFSGALALQDNGSTNDGVKVVILASFSSHHQSGRSGPSCTISNLRTKQSVFAERGAPTSDVALMLDVKNRILSWVNEERLAERGPDVVLYTCAGELSRVFEPPADSELDPLYKQIAKPLDPEPLRLQK